MFRSQLGYYQVLVILDYEIRLYIYYVLQCLTPSII